MNFLLQYISFFKYRSVFRMVCLSVLAQWATSRLWNILNFRQLLHVGSRIIFRHRSWEYTAQNQTAPYCYPLTREYIAVLI